MNKKTLLIGLLSLLPILGSAEVCKEPELNISGLSHHWTKKSYYSKVNGYNEENYGLGLTCHLNGIGVFNDEIEFGFLKNSFRETATYMAYGVYYPINESFEMGVRNIVASGYENSQMNINGFIGGPLLAAKIKINNKVTLNFSGFPSGSINDNHFDGFIYVNLGVKF